MGRAYRSQIVESRYRPSSTPLSTLSCQLLLKLLQEDLARAALGCVTGVGSLVGLISIGRWRVVCD